MAAAVRCPRRCHRHSSGARGRAHAIAGVMPRTFTHPHPDTQLWTPVALSSAALDDRKQRPFRVVARLARRDPRAGRDRAASDRRTVGRGASRYPSGLLGIGPAAPRLLCRRCSAAPLGAAGHGVYPAADSRLERGEPGARTRDRPAARNSGSAGTRRRPARSVSAPPDGRVALAGLGGSAGWSSRRGARSCFLSCSPRACGPRATRYLAGWIDMRVCWRR